MQRIFVEAVMAERIIEGDGSMPFTVELEPDYRRDVLLKQGNEFIWVRIEDVPLLCQYLNEVVGEAHLPE